MSLSPEEQETLHQLQLLRKLNQSEDFAVWRDMVAKPLLTQLEETVFTQADNLSEVVLRSNLKYYNTLKSLFYGWFEDVDDRINVMVAPELNSENQG